MGDRSLESVRRALVSVFPAARPGTIADLVASGGAAIFAQGQTIAGPGAPVLLIQGGLVARLVRSADGREVACALLRGGDIAGLTGLREDHGALTLMTWRPVDAITWAPNLIRELIAGDPGLGLDVIDRLLEVTAAITAELDELHALPSRARLARICLRYQDLVFDPDRPALRRGNLATLMGTSREMMDRCLRQLEDARAIIRTAGGGLVLLDPEMLRRLAS